MGWCKLIPIPTRGVMRRYSGPKRRIARKIRNLDVTGASGDLNLSAGTRPQTLVRTIINGVYYLLAEASTQEALHMEMWRLPIGVTLPAQELVADISYSESDDLIWVQTMVGVRETTSDGFVIPYAIDLKSMRKLDLGEKIIIRFAGDDLRFAGTITSFFKDV